MMEDWGRYLRQITLPEIGVTGQEKLHRSKVLVVGAGGLGCPVLQYLNAAGVGHIHIVDGDVVSESNLHRQVLFGSQDIGRKKAKVAKEKLQLLNQDTHITLTPQFLGNQNVWDLIHNADLVVDCTDQIFVRYLIDDVCRLQNKPWIYGGIYKYEGQVALFRGFKSVGYRDLFPTPPKTGAYASCVETGVLGTLPGIIGSIQANEALKYLLGFEETLDGKLWVFDAKSLSSQIIELSGKEQESIPLSRDAIESCDYKVFCGESLAKEISPERALKEKGQWIDIREPHETPKFPFSHKSIYEVDFVDLLEKDEPIYVFCQSGKRSAEFVAQYNGHKNVFSVSGGIKRIEKIMRINHGS